MPTNTTVRARTRRVTTALVGTGALLGASLLATPTAHADDDQQRILIYDHNTVQNQGFSTFGAAVGLDQETVSDLPMDLSDYACVVLVINQSLPEEAFAALDEYTTGGGHLIALGEYALFTNVKGTMDRVASELGSTLRLGSDILSGGATVTTNIDDTALTQGVNRVVFGGTNTVTLGESSAALSLVRNFGEPPQPTILAAEPVGDGLFVLSGDSNIFSDRLGTEFEANDNGVLAKNLCLAEAGPTYEVVTVHDAAKANKAGSTVPVKVHLTAEQGDAAPPEVVLTATELTHDTATSISPVPSPGKSFPGGVFKHDPDTGDYQVNVKTTGLASGTWTLHFTATGEDTDYTTTFTIR